MPPPIGLNVNVFMTRFTNFSYPVRHLLLEVISIVTIMLLINLAGPGTWKLNNSLLDENNFCEVIRKLIADHISLLSAINFFQDWWEFLKQSIKEDFYFFFSLENKTT